MPGTAWGGKRQLLGGPRWLMTGRLPAKLTTLPVAGGKVNPGAEQTVNCCSLITPL